MKRISILTASFGEGHNTAARNVRDALVEVGGTEVAAEICDLYQRTNPRLNRSMQVGYSVAINRFPKFWKIIFGMLEMRGLLEIMLPTLASLRKAMESHFREFRPDLIVSTYPVYSFLVREIQKNSPFLKSPLVSIVTDSTNINSAWYRCPSDYFIVSDALTEKALTADGVNPACIQTLGFPVSPRFADLKRIPDNTPAAPIKILFLPSTRKRHTIACLDRLLRIPELELTVTTGKNQELHYALQKAGFDNTPGVRLLGWTDQMPELMASHHLFLGKAGGAVVQEAIAARIPFLVSHIVPGQEEGNVELLHKLDIGALATGSPDQLANSVLEVFANNAEIWQRWKRNLAEASHPNAAKNIAKFLLSL